MITIIYLLGAGNSGSTLLSMALGSHSEIFSAGELSQVDMFLRENRVCTCGAAMTDCVFWAALAEDRRAGTMPGALRRPRLKSRAFGDPTRDPEFTDIVDASVRLYQWIAEKSGKEIIIDASKDPARFAYLARSGRVRLIPVHMVRDGRAYFDSAARRQGGKANPFKTTWRWARMNVVAAVLLRRLGLAQSALHFDYREFTDDPPKILKRICESSGVAYEPGMLEYFQNTFHNVAGTRERRSLGPISARESWRDRMSFNQKLGFALAGGHIINRSLGVGAAQKTSDKV